MSTENITEQPTADRVPRNAPDRASFSVGRGVEVTKKLRKSLERLVKSCKQVSAALDAEMAKPSNYERGERIAKITNFLEWEKDYAEHFGLGTSRMSRRLNYD